MKKIYYYMFAYFVLGLVFGVFYREFTVYHQFDGRTQLAFLHTHTLILGGFFFLIVLILNELFDISSYKRFSIWLILYNIGLVGFLTTMLIRGMGQVLSWELSGLNHVAGLFHTILGGSIIWFLIIIGIKLKEKKLVS